MNSCEREGNVKCHTLLNEETRNVIDKEEKNELANGLDLRLGILLGQLFRTFHLQWHDDADVNENAPLVMAWC